MAELPFGDSISEEYNPLRVGVRGLLHPLVVRFELCNHILKNKVSLLFNNSNINIHLCHCFQVSDYLEAGLLDAAVGDVEGCVRVDACDDRGERRAVPGVRSRVPDVSL